MPGLTHAGFTPGTDFLLPFHIPNLGVHGRLVRLGPALDAMLAPHRYPQAVATVMAECTVLAVALAGGLKYNGIFSLQISSDGPAGLLVADVTSEGAIRGYARADADDAVWRDMPVPTPLPLVLGAGHMAFTIDQGPDTERYQGITDLAGASMAECAEHYFRQSEQLLTAVRMASAAAGGAGHASDRPARGGAMVLQRLPRHGGHPVVANDDADADDAWQRAVIFVASLSDGELLDPSLAPEQVLHRLFHQDDLTIENRRPLVHACRCSRERVAMTLRSFPKDEIDSFKIDGRVEVTCEFCKAVYDFDELALARLFKP
ncbi:MAG: Hsp33 family molecular chaperone HslO [Proteobacteria bacterium]|nr:Hsp33 family molecular chaperone HslO [Pseudomonadota bacterium]